MSFCGNSSRRGGAPATLRYMADLLLAVGYAAGAIIAGLLLLGGGAAVVLRWRLGVANRVCPSVKSRAPLWWLCSPASAARLHRRLRAAVRLTRVSSVRRPAAAPAMSVESLGRDLELAAAKLDEELIVAAHYPAAHRRQLLRTLEMRVSAVERLAIRLATMSEPIAGTGTASVAAATDERVLDDLSEQVDALEAARAELTEINAAMGLPVAPKQRRASTTTTTH